MKSARLLLAGLCLAASQPAAARPALRVDCPRISEESRAGIGALIADMRRKRMEAFHAKRSRIGKGVEWMLEKDRRKHAPHLLVRNVSLHDTALDDLDLAIIYAVIDRLPDDAILSIADGAGAPPALVETVMQTVLEERPHWELRLDEVRRTIAAEAYAQVQRASRHIEYQHSWTREYLQGVDAALIEERVRAISQRDLVDIMHDAQGQSRHAANIARAAGTNRQKLLLSPKDGEIWKSLRLQFSPQELKLVPHER